MKKIIVSLALASVLLSCKSTVATSNKQEEVKVTIDLIDVKDPDLKKRYWWQMIQLLPSSYNQKRTVMVSYEVLANIYKSRKDHKLDEWCEHDRDNIYKDGLNEDFGLCDWIKTLPYSELITG